MITAIKTGWQTTSLICYQSSICNYLNSKFLFGTKKDVMAFHIQKTYTHLYSMWASHNIIPPFLHLNMPSIQPVCVCVCACVCVCVCLYVSAHYKSPGVELLLEWLLCSTDRTTPGFHRLPHDLEGQYKKWLVFYTISKYSSLNKKRKVKRVKRTFFTLLKSSYGWWILVYCIL